MEGSKNILSGFAYYLIEHGLLEKQVALNALELSIHNKSSYIESLTKQKLVNESDIATITAEYFGFPVFDINGFKKDLIPNEYLNIDIVKKRLALPLFKKGNLLYMAIADPMIENLYEIRFATGLDIRFFIGEISKIAKLVDELYNTDKMTVMSLQIKQSNHSNIIEEETDKLDYDIDSAPVVNYLNKLVTDAMEMNATDIHIERYANSCRIRYRVDGVLIAAASVPSAKLINCILARIKVISNLNVKEPQLLQEGRFKLNISQQRSVDFCVAVCPMLFGEKIVLRILDPDRMINDIEKLGMSPAQLECLREALQTQGLILVTGPADSGKTVTLYSSLNYLNTVEKNISTIENPVEIFISGLNQVNINPPAGLTFATALHAFLQQDLDIIMAGEMPDLETVKIAMKTAQAGRLVLSSLQTNSAIDTIKCLMSMGVSAYDLTRSLSIVISQRLIRILCDKCKVKEDFPEETLVAAGFKKEEIGKLELYSAAVCDHCHHGYNGRAGIFEMMPITTEIRSALLKGENISDIAKIAKQQGMVTLWESGLQKVREGKTSLHELNHVYK